MTLKPKKNLIIAAIRADANALIDGALVDTHTKVCERVGHCAIGALLAFAGASSDTLRRMPATTDRMWPAGGGSSALIPVEPRPGLKLNAYAGHILEEVYGLDRQNAGRIMDMNDTCDVGGGDVCKQARRRARMVIAFVRKL